MFSVSLPNSLFFLEVEAYDGFVRLFDRFLLLDALEVLLLVLRDLLCVESNAVTVVCVARRSWPRLGPRSRRWRPRGRISAGNAVDATLHTNGHGRRAFEVLAAVAIAADAALSVSVEADGTRLPEVRVPPASS